MRHITAYFSGSIRHMIILLRLYIESMRTVIPSGYLWPWTHFHNHREPSDHGSKVRPFPFHLKTHFHKMCCSKNVALCLWGYLSIINACLEIVQYFRKCNAKAKCVPKNSARAIPPIRRRLHWNSESSENIFSQCPMFFKVWRQKINIKALVKKMATYNFEALEDFYFVMFF